jgi:hypothetical protein
LKINKDKGREVVVMVVGGSRGIFVLIKPWWMLETVEDKWIIWFQIKTNCSKMCGLQRSK